MSKKKGNKQFLKNNINFKKSFLKNKIEIKKNQKKISKIKKIKNKILIII